MDMNKPHKGDIKDWWRFPATDKGLGYMIVGMPDGYPAFHGQEIRTSYVVKHEGNEIETRNSRYTLVGDAKA